jgi:hypothetical protein
MFALLFRAELPGNGMKRNYHILLNHALFFFTFYNSTIFIFLEVV